VNKEYGKKGRNPNPTKLLLGQSPQIDEDDDGDDIP